MRVGYTPHLNAVQPEPQQICGISCFSNFFSSLLSSCIEPAIESAIEPATVTVGDGRGDAEVATEAAATEVAAARGGGLGASAAMPRRYMACGADGRVGFDI